MVWYRELGFSSNPFSIKPGAFSSEIVGYDLSEILKKIEEARVLFIEGEYGFGKTSILKHIIAQFGGHRKVAYYNCNRADETINTHGILRGSKGFFARLVGVMPSDLILLLDEVERISQNDQKDLLKHYKEGHIKSIVFFGPDFDKISFSIELRKLMVNNVIKLTELTENEAVQLVRERVGNLKLLDDRIIKLVFRHSSNNPRLMLENLEDVLKYAVDNNEEQVTDDHLKEVLGIEAKPRTELKPKEAKQKKKAAKPQKAKPQKKEQSPKPKEAKPRQEKPKLVKPAEPKPKPTPPKPKEAKPKQEKPKPAKPAEPKPKRERHPKEKPEEEFEDKKPKKKAPNAPIDYEEETDYSEPAEEEPGEDDKGGEYYYYY
jgi:hypothetical protein